MEELNKEKSTKKTEAKKQDTKSSRKRLAKIDSKQYLYFWETTLFNGILNSLKITSKHKL